MKLTKGFLGALLFTLCGAQMAIAHSYLPQTPGQSITVIPDINVSRAAYREITAGDQVDVYEFTAKKGQQIYIQMTVPLLDRLSGFAPEFALVSMGDGQASFDAPLLEMGTVSDPPHDVVDRIHPHAGADETEPPLIGVAYDNSPAVVFDEPFTGTRYWTRQTLTIAAPADGTYRIGVYSRDGSKGKYVLAPGKTEAFGIGDIFGLPIVRLQVRGFCEQPIWPDLLVEGVIVAGLITGGVFLIAGAAH
jgi:hypothetical protein